MRHQSPLVLGLACAAVALATLLRSWHLGAIPLDYDAVKQCQAMLLIRALAEQGPAAILHARPAWSPEHPFFWQLPLYHLIVISAAKLANLMPDSISLARAVTVLCSLLTAWPVYIIGRKLTDSPKSGCWASVTFLLLPFSIVMGRVVMDDALWMLLVTSTLAAFLIWRKDEGSDRAFWTGAVLWMVAIAVRPYAILLVLPIAGCCWRRLGVFWWGDRRVHALFASVSLLLILWLGHMQVTESAWAKDSLYTATRFTGQHYKPLNFIQKILVTTGVLFSPDDWKNHILGKLRDYVCPLALLPAFLPGLFLLLRESWIARLWLAANAFYFIAFAGIIVGGHNYYMYAFAPFVAIATGRGLGALGDWLEVRHPSKNLLSVAVACACAALILLGSLTGLKKLTAPAPQGRQVFQPYTIPLKVGEAIAELNSQDELFILTADEAHHTYPVVHYAANRKGWNFQPQYVLGDWIETLREKGATLWVVEGEPADWPAPLQEHTANYPVRKTLTFARAHRVYHFFDLGTKRVRTGLSRPDWLPYRFLNHVQEAETYTSSDLPSAAVRRTGIDAGDGARNVILTQPVARENTTITFTLPAIPIRTRLRAALALAEHGWRPPQNSDGVIAGIVVEYQEQRQTLLRVPLNPRDVPSDRGWQYYQFDLPAMPHGPVKITFACNPGPTGNWAWDVAGWADLVLDPHSEMEPS